MRVELTTLRKIFGDEFILADRDTVQLNSQVSLWIDAREIGNVRLEIYQTSVSNLQSLIALYRSDLLADFYDDWITAPREQLRTHYLDILLHLTQHYRSQSDYARAIEYAQLILVTDPANERAHQHLMFCHLANGDRSAALQQLGECQRALRDDLGVEPSPETIALHQWLKQDAGDKSTAARLTNLPISAHEFCGATRRNA